MAARRETGKSVAHDMTADRARKNLPFATILGVIVLARLAFAALVYARPELAIANDTDRYVPIANGILSGRAYQWNTERPGELLNTIGYPLFLAGVFATLGDDPGDVALAQLLCTGALACSTFFVLSRRLNKAAGFAAGLLLALDPLTILWSMTMLTETVFAVALGASALLLVSWAYSRRETLVVWAGLAMGLACLVKPFAMLIAAAWLIAVAFFPRDQDGASGLRFRIRVRDGLLFVAPVVLLLAPWFVRNGLLWNCATLSSVDRVTMRDYMAGKVLAEAEHIDLADAQSRLQEADPGLCPGETSKYLGILASNPTIYLRLHVAGTIPVLIGTNFDRWLQYLGREYQLPDLWRPYMDGGWRRLVSVLVTQLRAFPAEVGLMIALTVFQLLLYVLAVSGVIESYRLPTAATKWISAVLVVAILILVLTPGQGGHERFRVPVQPLLAMLVALGVAEKTRGSTAKLSPSAERTGSRRPIRNNPVH